MGANQCTQKCSQIAKEQRLTVQRRISMHPRPVKNAVGNACPFLVQRDSFNGKLQNHGSQIRINIEQKYIQPIGGDLLEHSVWSTLNIARTYLCKLKHNHNNREKLKPNAIVNAYVKLGNR